MPAVGHARYFAEGLGELDERERLSALEANYDPGTVELLRARGVSAGWHCVEVGAGGGSIVAWLAGVVGEEGSVLALDIDITHLGPVAALGNVEVRRHDVTAETIGAARFDLVHTRLVIEHLPHPEDLLAMLAGAVRPGGRLVVECTDMRATGAADASDPRSAPFDRLMAVSFAAVESVSTFDLDFARRMPSVFARLRLEDFDYRVAGSLARGGDSKSLEYALGTRAIAPVMVGQGVTTEDEVARNMLALTDPTFWFVANNVVAAWGRRAMD
jgi:SAM-dependent methyltransferase